MWLKGRINSVVSDIFVDTGSEYTIIDFESWRKLCFDNTIFDTRVRLVGAGGESLSVVGEGKVWLEIGKNCLEDRVILVEDFKFNVLLGDDFLKSQCTVTSI